MFNTQTLKHSTVVQFHYRIKDLDGKEIESNFNEQAVANLHGHNNIMPGIQNSLESMSKGDELEVELEVSQTYGDIQADCEQRISVKYVFGLEKIAQRKSQSEKPE